MKRHAALFLSLAVWCPWATAAPPPSPDEAVAALQRGLDDRLRHEGQPGLPGLAAQMRERQLRGLSIAVIHQGRLAWARGFGEAQAGVPVTADTRFQAGSISKPVGALTALTLASQQGVGLDQDLRPLLRSWQPPDDDSATPRYTLRRLLSHSAGLGQHGFPGYAPGLPLPSTAQILDGLAPANTGAVRPVEAPGQRFRYSGGGSTIVQQWIEDQSGQPYAAVAQRLVMQPLGMAHSHIGPPEDAADHARAHQRGVAEPGGWRVYPEGIAAGLWTTPSDLARLLIAVQAARAGQPGPLQPAVARDASTPVLPPTSPGFFIEGRFFGHNGSNQGFESLATAALDGGDGLVLMANDNGSWPLMDALRRTVARLYGWSEGAAPLALADQRLPASAPAWAGDYGSSRLRWAQGQLWLAPGPGQWQRLWRVQDGSAGAFATAQGERLRLSAAGLQRGSDALLPRQPPGPLPPVQPLLRGSFNAWGTAQALREVAPGRWQIDTALPAGRSEFKIGDADWGLVNLGGGHSLQPGRWQALQAQGGNLLLDLPQAGRWRLTLQMSDSPTPPRLKLQRLR